MRNLWLTVLLTFSLAACGEDKISPAITAMTSKIVPVAQKILPKSIKPLEAKAASCIDDEWGHVLAFAPQNASVEERIEVSGGTVIAYTFDALVGEYAKEYLFTRDNGECVDGAFSVGSYAAQNADADVQVYHFDLYATGSHSTIDLGQAKPAYADARQIALRYLK
jgi:hypothetical protein